MHTGSALHTAALIDEVERLATRDSLTGIANRRLFDESLVREAARAQRLKTPLSLVVFDVDHFKQINDTYGHVDRRRGAPFGRRLDRREHEELRRRRALRRRRVRAAASRLDQRRRRGRGRACAGRDRTPGARGAGHGERGPGDDARTMRSTAIACCRPRTPRSTWRSGAVATAPPCRSATRVSCRRWCISTTRRSPAAPERGRRPASAQGPPPSARTPDPRSARSGLSQVV